MSVELCIGGVQIRPGSAQNVEFRLPLLYTHTPVVMSARVLRGRCDGPRLFVSGAVHGDEINGVEIVRRLARLPALKRLCGTLILVPVVNVYGFVRQSRYLPDRRDLNRSFPGSDEGSLAARLASAFLDEVVDKSDFGIDLHTGAVHRDNLPQVRADLGAANPAIERLARAFGSAVILNSETRDGSLREAAAERGVPVIVYEGGEALRFDESVIRAGVNGVLGVMRELGMLKPTQSNGGKSRPDPLLARSSQWVRAPCSGILRAEKGLGAMVNRQEILGWIADTLGENEIALKSPVAGIIIGKVNLPLVNEGEALYHIARPEAASPATDDPDPSRMEAGPQPDQLPVTEPTAN